MSESIDEVIRHLQEIKKAGAAIYKYEIRPELHFYDPKNIHYEVVLEATFIMPDGYSPSLKSANG